MAFFQKKLESSDKYAFAISSDFGINGRRLLREVRDRSSN